MIGLLDGIKIGAGALLGAALAATPAYYLGKRDGRTEAAQAALETTLHTLRERKLTDEQIQSMDDAGLCAALGGLLTDGRCE